MLASIHPETLHPEELAIYRQFDGFLSANGYTGAYNPAHATDPAYFLYEGIEPMNLGRTIRIELVNGAVNIQITKAKQRSAVFECFAVAAVVLTLPLVLLLTLGGKQFAQKLLDIRLFPARSFRISEVAAQKNIALPDHTLTNNYEDVISAQREFMEQHLLAVIHGTQWPRGLRRVGLRN